MRAQRNGITARIIPGPEVVAPEHPCGGRAHEVAAQKCPLKFLSAVPGYVGLYQFRRHLRRQNAFEQAEMILPAA